MRSRLAQTLLIIAALVASLVGTSVASAARLATASAAQAPVTPSGTAAQLVTRYVGTPTSFAFSRNHVFMSDGTLHPLGIGGVYELNRGLARRLPHSPVASDGLAWRNGTLFISAGNEILAWSGWTGRKFTRRRVLLTAPQGSPGFNGLAIGPTGRLYTGVARATTPNAGGPPDPYKFDILSMTGQGGDVSIVAHGIRQPWQLAFPAGSFSPLVTDPGQLAGGRRAPDLLLRVRQGQDYGFPTCNWTRTALCQGFARPVRFFPAHTDPLGLAIVGRRLFISEFGVRTPAQVISVPLSGVGQEQVALSGFPPGRNIDGLGVDHGWIYVGETAAGRKHFGSVWRFQP